MTFSTRNFDRVAVFWSGGKDSFLAYQTIAATVRDCVFITFVPPADIFYCHPLGLLTRQSERLGIEHDFVVLHLDGYDTWLNAYYDAIRYIKEVHKITAVVTGDIFYDIRLIEDYWLHRLCLAADLDLVLPLAGRTPSELFSMLAAYKIHAVVSGVSNKWLNPNLLPNLLGKRICSELLDTFALQNPGFDLMGEGGEYHTAVIGCASDTYASEGEGLGEKPLLGAIGELAVLDWPDNLLRLKRRRISTRR